MHPVVDRYMTDEMKRILSYEHRVAKMLEVEATLALVEAEYGLIPMEAALEIAGKASLEHVKPERIREIEARIHHETLAMVEALIDVVDERAKGYVHYGVTSSDILDTSLALVLRDALELIENDLRSLKCLLIRLADKYRSLPCIGRTHGQHALPITCGMKFALWGSEVQRHIERLREVRRRVLVGKISGAVGTMAALGEKGPEIQETVLKRLGLGVPLITNQVVQRDRYAELVFLMALIASTLDKIGKEIRNLQRTEIGEFYEPFARGQAGSSTMPHKRNPHKSERICSLARYLRALVIPALENIPLEHERDLTNSANERIVFFDSLALIDYMLRQMHSILSGLTIDEASVKRNLNLTRGVIMAERVMLSLAKRGMSRAEAYKLVQRLSFEAYSSGKTFKDVLLEDETIGRYLKPEEIEYLCNPETYLGQAEELVRDTVRAVGGDCP